MELSITDIKELIGNRPTADHGFRVGEKYLFRTVTYHITGEITAINGGFLTLKDAAWIADSGRLMQAVQTSDFAEVEPLPDGTKVNVHSLTDAIPITRCPTGPRPCIPRSSNPSSGNSPATAPTRRDARHRPGAHPGLLRSPDTGCRPPKTAGMQGG